MGAFPTTIVHWAVVTPRSIATQGDYPVIVECYIPVINAFVMNELIVDWNVMAPSPWNRPE